MFIKKPDIKLKQKQSGVSVFSEVFGGSGIKLEELLLRVTKIDEIEQSYIWKEYYP